MQVVTKTLLRVVAVCLTFFFSSALAVPVAASWQVEQAPIRFKVRLWASPTEKSAGYVMQLPDGGILPRPFPHTHVVLEDGTKLQSFALWQNRESGMVIVFEAPIFASDAYVYVRGAGQLNLWTPRSGLTPSPILGTDPTRGSMEAARKLSKLGAVGPAAQFCISDGHERAPICILGDLSGRPAPSSFYLLAYLVVRKPERIWVAPILNKGTSEVLINGRSVSRTHRIDKWGGVGQWIDFDVGLHRLDVLNACDKGVDYTIGKGVMFMAWRRSGDTMDDLGGERSKDEPFPGTSAWESRAIRSDEIARSGSCRIREAHSRDGGPVARIHHVAVENFWFDGATPIFIYRLTALTDGNPDDTRYTWSFGDEARAVGKQVSWFFCGNRDHKVTLTAVSGSRKSQATVPFFAFSSIQSSMNDESARKAFRNTCLDTFLAYPEKSDPTAKWDRDMWDCFMRNMELGTGRRLLAHIFTKRWTVIRKKLDDEQRRFLEDLFLAFAPGLNADAALQWVGKFEQGASQRREEELAIARAEILMYYKMDFEEAKAVLEKLAPPAARSEMAQRARIRIGDVALLEGDLAMATRYYSLVQGAESEGEASGSGTTGDGTEDTDDWKQDAVNDVAFSETTRSLLGQRFFPEAALVLREWERDFPLTKITGDYILLEARLLMALKEYSRARLILEAYCDQIDASAFIPPAVEAVLDCMMEMDEPDEVIIKYVERIKKRLEFHPAADRLDGMLRILKGEEGPREATSDKVEDYE